MTEASQDFLSVLEALTSAPAAWMSPAAVARRLGRDVEETTDILASLDEAGLVLVREVDGMGPQVSASPRGADLARRGFAPRPQASRDRRPAAAWSGPYERPSRPLIAATAAGSVAS